MSQVHSVCCAFSVGKIEDADAYCYVCGHVHKHGHLDLRHLRGVLLGKVVGRHKLDWQEIEKDTKKFGGMQRGVFCQSVLTEIQALCPHGNPITYANKPLRLHMCYGADTSPSDDPSAPSDLSVQQGLDFTSDLCDEPDSVGAEPDLRQFAVAIAAKARAGEFNVGDTVRYNAARVAFERA